MGPYHGKTCTVNKQINKNVTFFLCCCLKKQMMCAVSPNHSWPHRLLSATSLKKQTLRRLKIVSVLIENVIYTTVAAAVMKKKYAEILDKRVLPFRWHLLKERLFIFQQNTQLHFCTHQKNWQQEKKTRTVCSFEMDIANREEFLMLAENLRTK